MVSTEGLADYQPEDPRGSGPRSRKLKPIGSIFLDFEKKFIWKLANSKKHSRVPRVPRGPRPTFQVSPFQLMLM